MLFLGVLVPQPRSILNSRFHRGIDERSKPDLDTYIFCVIFSVTVVFFEKQYVLVRLPSIMRQTKAD